MKKYLEPKVKTVSFDPEQAILEVCKVGGQYFNGSTICAYLATMPAPVSMC